MYGDMTRTRTGPQLPAVKPEHQSGRLSLQRLNVHAVERGIVESHELIDELVEHAPWMGQGLVGSRGSVRCHASDGPETHLPAQ
jgi:hypothetical protein